MLLVSWHALTQHYLQRWSRGVNRNHLSNDDAISAIICSSRVEFGTLFPATQQGGTERPCPGCRGCQVLPSLPSFSAFFGHSPAMIHLILGGWHELEPLQIKPFCRLFWSSQHFVVAKQYQSNVDFRNCRLSLQVFSCPPVPSLCW